LLILSALRLRVGLRVRVRNLQPGRREALFFHQLHGEHPFVTSACIGSIQPLTAWSPGFSRSKLLEPPEGGTPNQPRFMERAPSCGSRTTNSEMRRFLARPGRPGANTCRPALFCYAAARCCVSLFVLFSFCSPGPEP